MKNVLLILSLFITQFIYGQYEKISVKELRELGPTLINKNVSIDCDNFESTINSILLNMDGEPTSRNDMKKTNITDGKPHFIEEELITIVDEYEEFNVCYVFGINKREFVDKYDYRDITMFGKIVGLESGGIGFKITEVKKRITLSNLYMDYTVLFVLSLFVIGFLLLLIIKMLFFVDTE